MVEYACEKRKRNFLILHNSCEESVCADPWEKHASAWNGWELIHTHTHTHTHTLAHTHALSVAISVSLRLSLSLSFSFHSLYDINLKLQTSQYLFRYSEFLITAKLEVCHRNLSDSKSSPFSIMPLSIQTDLNRAVVWTASILFQLSTSPTLSSWFFEIGTMALYRTGITVTFLWILFSALLLLYFQLLSLGDFIEPQILRSDSPSFY